MALLLVVDDHPLFRDGFTYMARVLRPAWTVRFADSAPMALGLLREITQTLSSSTSVFPEKTASPF